MREDHQLPDAAQQMADQPTWSGRAILGEAWRNTAARPMRFVLLALVTTMVLLAICLAETLTASSIQSRQRAAVAAGSTTVKVTGDASTPIAARDCADLEGQAGIIAAGGLGDFRTVYAANSPGLGFGEADSVGDIIGALTGKSNRYLHPGLIIPTELAGELGVVTGSHVSVGQQTEPIASIQPLDQRDQTLGRTALDPVAPNGTVSACYIQFDEQAFTTGLTIINDHFSGIKALQVQPLMSVQASDNPTALWSSRATRYGWIVAGLILVMFFFFAGRSRRPEYAVYLINGSSRSTIAMLYILEHAMVIAGAIATALAWQAFLTVMLHAGWTPYHAGLEALIRTSLVLVSLTPLGAMWLLRSNLSAVLRERAS